MKTTNPILLILFFFLVTIFFASVIPFPNSDKEDYKPRDTIGVGRQVYDVINELDTIPVTITTLPPKYDSSFIIPQQDIPEVNYGDFECDTITTAELDVSATYTDLKRNFIIYGGEVFFRADVVGEEEKAKEVLDTLHAIIQRANNRSNK